MKNKKGTNNKSIVSEKEVMKRFIQFTRQGFLTVLLLSIGSSMVCKQFVLITSLYNEKNEARRQEYLTCLKNNIAHPMIKNVHIIYDKAKDDQNNSFREVLKNLANQKPNKLRMSLIKGRPSYSFCFDLANRKYPNSPLILSNGDVFFNETLHALDNYDLTGKMLALTRWSITAAGDLYLCWLLDKQGKFRRDWAEHSQDAWIFNTPIRPINGNILLGTWNCDSLIAYQIGQSGLEIFNPCLTIQCCHLHLTEVRHYVAIQSQGPFLPLPWCTLDKPSITPIDFNCHDIKTMKTLGYPVKSCACIS